MEPRPGSPFSVTIRSLMAQAGVSATELAKALGVSRQAVSAWRQGRAIPDGGRIEDAVRFFQSRGLAVVAISTEDEVKRHPAVIRETAPGYSASSSSAFAEHVLFTAGRIAELANQIERAAQQQLGLTQDLGRRAEVGVSVESSRAREAAARVRGKAPKPNAAASTVRREGRG